MPETLTRPPEETGANQDPSLDPALSGSEPIGEDQPELFGPEELDQETAEYIPEPITKTGEADQEVRDSQEDAENRYEDRILLGNSYRVRNRVEQAGNWSVKKWKAGFQHIKNAATSPKQALKTYAHHRAQKSYDHKQTRLNQATSERLISKRQAKANEAAAKLASRKTDRDEYNQLRKRRVSSIHENANAKRQEYVKDLLGKKANSLARKELRSQLRSENASRKETREILAEIPKEHWNKVGKAVITSEASKHIAGRSERAESREARRVGSAEDNIVTTESTVESHNQAAAEADRKAKDIKENLLPQVKVRITALQEKVNNSDPYSQESLDANTELSSLIGQRNQYQRDLLALPSQANKHRRNAERARESLRGQEDKLTKQKAKAALSKERAKTHKNRAATNKALAGAAVKAALSR